MAAACGWMRSRLRSTELKSRGVAAEIHLHHPDGAEPDRHRSCAKAAPRRAAEAVAELYGVPIFEDDCYADLIWDGEAPARAVRHEQDRRTSSISARSPSRSRRRCASATSWRPGRSLSRMLPIKFDAGSGALEQMVLAEFCAPHFTEHVPKLTRGLRAKLETLMEALERAVRHRGRVRGAQGRHLSVGQASRQRRHA